jgi:hypothetical protein
MMAVAAMYKQWFAVKSVTESTAAAATFDGCRPLRSHIYVLQTVVDVSMSM